MMRAIWRRKIYSSAGARVLRVPNAVQGFESGETVEVELVDDALVVRPLRAPEEESAEVAATR